MSKNNNTPKKLLSAQTKQEWGYSSPLLYLICLAEELNLTAKVATMDKTIDLVRRKVNINKELRPINSRIKRSLTVRKLPKL